MRNESSIMNHREVTRRNILFAPDVLRSMSQGVDTMVALLAPTLGPTGRTVAVASLLGANHPPEILTDAGTIARRVVKIPDPYVNAGAMIVRDMARSMREEIGDGVATAVVLARAMVRAGMPVVAAGANPMLIRRGLEEGLRTAAAELRTMAQPPASQETIAALAGAATGDSEMGDIIAEIFDIVGLDGAIIIEDYVGRVTDREYVDGVHWDSCGLVSSDFLTDVSRREARVLEPLIAIADLAVASSAQVVPILELALREGAKSLVFIAPKIEGEALGTLVLNKDKLPIVPIKAPGFLLPSQPEILRDLAILTGATFVEERAGRSLAGIQVDDLGRARQVIATLTDFTVAGGRGRQKDIHKRLAELRVEMAHQDLMAQAQAHTLWRRLANLSGGVAILKIGGNSQAEGRLRRNQAEVGVRSVRSALEEGVVPGGGSAYLACVPAVEASAQAVNNSDQAAGVRVVANALAAPLQQLADNAGYSGATAAARVRLAGAGFGFDVRSGTVVDMREAGILDPVKVLSVALRKATSVAAMLLTTEAMVSSPKRRIPSELS
jgi:chaperonin GroEL